MHTRCGSAGGLLTWAVATQVDSHLAELTVKETMDFSARVQGPGTKRGASPLAAPTLELHGRHSLPP